MEEVIYAFIERVWPRLLNDLQIWLNYTLMRTYERRNHEPKPSNSGDNRSVQIREKSQPILFDVTLQRLVVQLQLLNISCISRTFCTL